MMFNEDDAPASKLTVSEFIDAAKRRLESGGDAVWVEGEIATFTRAASGHWYFSLRDSAAQMDCVMLARQNKLVGAAPATGDRVLVCGKASLYAPRARFQLAALFMRRAGGEGRLHQLFMERKQAWRQNGWFDNARPPPPYPRAIGVVCSTDGAALRDVLKTLQNRYPCARVVIYPAPAQGAGAAEKIAAALQTANRRRECDVILITRGGGAIEDLWAYNEEPVTRAIYDSAIPVISGIGHETDETLADYAADHRASTPTAAAAAATPDGAALLETLSSIAARLPARLQDALDEHSQRLDWALRVFAKAGGALVAEKRHDCRQRAAALNAAATMLLADSARRLAARQVPAVSLAAQTGAISERRRRLASAAATALQTCAARLTQQASALELLSAQRQLARGYSIITDGAGNIVKRAAQAPAGAALNLTVSDGVVIATSRGAASAGKR